MKQLILTLTILIFSVNSLFALTGRQIIDKSDALPEAKSSKTTVLMTITKAGRTVEKKFKTISKKRNGNTKALISFIRPTQIKLLTHSYKNRKDDQWLRLSSGRVKRIAAGDKGKPFVNSHLFYEDLQSRNIDDYTYTKLADGKGVGFDCYKIKSVKKKKSSKVYDSVTLYVRKSDFFVVRVDFFKKGKILKYLENFNIKKVKGILTPFKVVVTQGNKKGSTIMMLKKLKYNVKISNSKFSKEGLR